MEISIWSLLGNTRGHGRKYRNQNVPISMLVLSPESHTNLY